MSFQSYIYNILGDLGHFANSVHPANPFIAQNAKIDKKQLKQTKSNKNMFQKRMSLNLIASQDISANEEVIINYGSGYWKAMEEFVRKGLKKKSVSVKNRDSRAEKRAFVKT